MPHSIVRTGDACLNCHNPHDSANEHLLNDSQLNVCLSCHNREISSPTYGLTDNIEQELLTAPYLHAPFEEGNCSACHTVHGGSFLHLNSTKTDALNVPYPQTNLDENCFQCHDYNLYVLTTNFPAPTVVSHPSSELPSQFVRVQSGSSTARNLHQYHARQGLTCYACHSTHSSNNRYFIKDKWSVVDPGSNFWTMNNCSTYCHN